MSAEAYPLQWPEGWPRTPADKQVRGWQFKQLDYSTGRRTLATFARARDALLGELRRLGAGHIVISTNHPTDRYGVPTESKRRILDEGVVIYFSLGKRQMAMACDRFDNAAANMRSLGLAIEAMRQLERHGGGAMMERAFSGFAALPPPRSCWDILGVPVGSSRTAIEKSFRERATAMHPDRGGSNAAMAELNAARDRARREVQQS